MVSSGGLKPPLGGRASLQRISSALAGAQAEMIQGSGIRSHDPACQQTGGLDRGGTGGPSWGPAGFLLGPVHPEELRTHGIPT